MFAFASAQVTAKPIPNTMIAIATLIIHSPESLIANRLGPTNAVQMNSVRKLN
jgi:hypothetical protein